MSKVIELVPDADGIYVPSGKVEAVKELKIKAQKTIIPKKEKAMSALDGIQTGLTILALAKRVLK